MIYDLQKASMWKRASAYILDIILLCIVATGFAFMLSAILGYDSYSSKLDSFYQAYEEKYSIDLDISAEDYEKLTDAEKAKYEEANKEFSKDTEVILTYNVIINMTLIMITFGILAAYLLLEFFVPLLFNNGQTVGKKIFGIAITTTDGIKISPFILFVRTIFGKFTIETMVPVFIVLMIMFEALGIVGIIVIALLLILQIVMLSITKTNSAIHDLIANTVAVDLSSQLIFNTPEELLEYKKRVHAENVEKSTY